MRNLSVPYGGVLGIALLAGVAWLAGRNPWTTASEPPFVAQRPEAGRLGRESVLQGGSTPEGEPTHRVELFHAFGKKPVLWVSYPWKVHARSSMEVRFLSPSEVDDERIRPLFFRSRYLKGKMLQEVYECWMQGAETPVRKSYTEADLEWRLLADRTILARAAVCVVREIPADRRLGTEAGVAVAYPFLEGWAQDEHHLCLELPGEYYPQPGQLRVWFLRENRVLWTEKLAWPGLKASSPPQGKSLSAPSHPQKKVLPNPTP